jgi:hypothetical protein
LNATRHTEWRSANSEGVAGQATQETQALKPRLAVRPLDQLT